MTSIRPARRLQTLRQAVFWMMRDARADWLVHRGVVRICLCRTRCAEHVTTEASRLALGRLDQVADQPVLEIAITLGRRGTLTMAGPGGGNPIPATCIDPALSSALVRAEAWKRQLYTSQAGSLAEIAEAEGVTVRYAARILRVAYLAPDLKRAILDGTQSERLTLETLVRQGAAPCCFCGTAKTGKQAKAHCRPRNGDGRRGMAARAGVCCPERPEKSLWGRLSDGLLGAVQRRLAHPEVAGK